MILGNLSENSHSERHEYKRNEIDTASAGLQENTKTLVEVFRFPLNSNSGGNSEITAETQFWTVKILKCLQLGSRKLTMNNHNTLT